MTRARETSENARQAKAWVNFDGTFGSSPFTIANGGIRGSFNVSSIIDNGVGIYTINFTNPMEDADYSVAGICSANIMGIIWDGGVTYTRTVSAYQFAVAYVVNFTGSGQVFDASKIQVIIFR